MDSIIRYMAGDYDVYTELAKKVSFFREAQVSKRFLAILEEMFTPEEAYICLELFEPATCQELAKRLNTDEKSLQATLDSLVDRGMIYNGKTQYGFSSSLHHDVVADTGVHTGPHAISQKVKDLWADYFRNEAPEKFVNMIPKPGEIRRGPMIWPAIKALELSPNILPEQILPEENWKLRIENAKRRIIAPCGCRVVWGVCNHPLETCFANFDNPRGEYFLGKPGRLLREISLEETMQIVYAAEEDGLVHWGQCYCCSCCCENLFPITKTKRFDLMAPNRFLAVVNEELCKGCQTCVERCPFEAIEMRQIANSKKLKADINSDKCKGCGLCIVGCKQKAIRYEIVRPPEYLLARNEIEISNWGFYDLK